MCGHSRGMESGEDGDTSQYRLRDDSEKLSKCEESNAQIRNESEAVEESSKRRDTENESEKSIPELDPDVEWILRLI